MTPTMGKIDGQHKGIEYLFSAAWFGQPPDEASHPRPEENDYQENAAHDDNPYHDSVGPKTVTTGGLRPWNRERDP